MTSVTSPFPHHSLLIGRRGPPPVKRLGPGWVPGWVGGIGKVLHTAVLSSILTLSDNTEVHESFPQTNKQTNQQKSISIILFAVA